MNEDSKQTKSELIWNRIESRGPWVQLWTVLGILVLRLIQSYATDAGLVTLLAASSTYLVAAHLLWALVAALTLIAMFKNKGKKVDG